MFDSGNAVTGASGAPHVVRWLEWPFDPANSAIVAGWGFWFGIAGLIGLAVAIAQLARTKSAADSANEAATRLRLSLVTYDVAQEASRASYALVAAKKHLLNAAWLDAAESYEDFRRSIVSIRANFGGLSDETGRLVDRASTYISKFCKQTDQDHVSGSVTIDIAKAKDVMRRHSQLIEVISSEIQKKVI